MKSQDGLPLFDWKPHCKILPFPEVRQVWRVQRAAATLSTGTQKQIAHNRQKIFEGVENRFLKVGVEPEVAAAERQRFEHAVAEEMRRRGLGSYVAIPDGAA